MSDESTSKLSLPVVVGCTALTIVLGIGAGRLVTQERCAFDGDAPIATASVREPARADAVEKVRYKIPVLSMQPTLGPADALVTINEFCDLRGAECRDADAMLQSLMKAYDGKLRWAHRTLIDAAQPEASHRMHAFTRAAFNRAGKFWEMREQFLKTPDGVELTEKDYERICQAVGLDYEQVRAEIGNRQHDAAIALDNVFSAKFGVSGKLGIFVNGRPLRVAPGADMKSALKALIDEELIEAEQLVQSGVAKDRIYDEITKGGRWGVSESDELARQAALAKQR